MHADETYDGSNTCTANACLIDSCPDRYDLLAPLNFPNSLGPPKKAVVTYCQQRAADLVDPWPQPAELDRQQQANSPQLALTDGRAFNMQIGSIAGFAVLVAVLAGAQARDLQQDVSSASAVSVSGGQGPYGNCGSTSTSGNAAVGGHAACFATVQAVPRLSDSIGALQAYASGPPCSAVVIPAPPPSPSCPATTVTVDWHLPAPGQGYRTLTLCTGVPARDAIAMTLPQTVLQTALRARVSRRQLSGLQVEHRDSDPGVRVVSDSQCNLPFDLHPGPFCEAHHLPSVIAKRRWNRDSYTQCSQHGELLPCRIKTWNLCQHR